MNSFNSSAGVSQKEPGCQRPLNSDMLLTTVTSVGDEPMLLSWISSRLVGDVTSESYKRSDHRLYRMKRSP